MTEKSKNQYRYFFIALICQILFFVLWYGLEAIKIKDPKSKTIIVKVLPIDPRDIISGNYFDLRYDFNFKASFRQKFQVSDDMPTFAVFAVLTRQDQGYFADYLSLQKPKVREDQVVIKGIYNNGFINFGIEKYFIDERFSQPTINDLIEAELVINESAEVRIKRLFINSKAIE